LSVSARPEDEEAGQPLAAAHRGMHPLGPVRGDLESGSDLVDLRLGFLNACRFDCEPSHLLERAVQRFSLRRCGVVDRESQTYLICSCLAHEVSNNDLTRSRRTKYRCVRARTGDPVSTAHRRS
jgi:hypothetical protein